MGSTNFTEHYDIPLPLGSDKTTPMDYNQSMQAVDTALFAAHGDASDAKTGLATTNQNVAQNTQSINALAGRVTTVEGTVSSQGTAITNLGTKVDGVEQDAQDMICAYNQASATASRNYAVGDYFIYNDVLYRATQAIASGATIVPDTNCTTTNVTSEIKSQASNIAQLNSDLANKVSKSHAADYTAHKDGTKTWAQLLYLVYANIDFSKVNAFSFIVAGANYFRISRIQENHVVFVYVNIGATTPQIIKYNIQENANTAVYWDGSTLADISSSVADEDISIFY